MVGGQCFAQSGRGVEGLYKGVISLGNGGWVE